MMSNVLGHSKYNYISLRASQHSFHLLHVSCKIHVQGWLKSQRDKLEPLATRMPRRAPRTAQSAAEESVVAAEYEANQVTP